MILFALDASTKTIGISIFEYTNFEDKKLLHFEYYKPNKFKKSLKSLTDQEMLQMLLDTRSYVIDLAKKYNVEEFVIEDYIRFMKADSAAATIIPLAILNMTLRITVLDQLNIVPIALNVMKIRHTIKKDHFPAKEEIPDLIAEHLGLEQFPWYTKINRRTKEEQKIEESYDVADSMAVGLAYIKLKSSGKSLVKEKVKKKKKSGKRNKKEI